MPQRRELPRAFEVDSFGDLDSGNPDHTFIAHSEYRPINEYDAVMRCAPFEEPEVSRDERLTMRDVIVDAIDGLDDQQRWIFDALFIRRCSLRQLGAEVQIPKTTLARRRDELCAVLREKLQNDPMIDAYLTSQMWDRPNPVASATPNDKEGT